MGFFDTLGKLANAAVESTEKKRDQMYKDEERYENNLKYKSDSDLKNIARDESQPYLKRVAAQRVYKSRH